ncbi:subunit beta of proteasome [Hamiltosporidium magnivora]|uniref:Subunit beta of proteasome n=1 Tax=Hamiltosporidium magnivora TaxID=148818 RepID=A0A4Q9KWR9_9MICR|nr:subunit beta of proteasome [Hamiltosporidium magnivora]
MKLYNIYDESFLKKKLEGLLTKMEIKKDLKIKENIFLSNNILQNSEEQETLKESSNGRFNPYENNSGTTLCIKQSGYIIAACDTRHSGEMNINSREMTKIYSIGDFILTTTGFYADSYELSIRLKYQINMYEVQHNKKITIHSGAHLLCNILYSKRFFPYFTFCCLCGFENKIPYIYSYDPVGSYQECSCRCNGSGAGMIQPLLDSLISKKNWNNCTIQDLNDEDGLKLVQKAFEAASERDVKTGDFLEVYIIKEGEIQKSVFPLRKD